PARPTLLDVGLEPDVGDGDDEERRGQHPRGVEELPLETAPGAVAAAQPSVAATDGPPQAGRLRRLQQHPRHEQDADDHLQDDERVSDVGHWTEAVYPCGASRAGWGVAVRGAFGWARDGDGGTDVLPCVQPNRGMRPMRVRTAVLWKS